MPYMTNGKRDYDKQQKYDGKPSVKKDRAKRNAARAKMIKAGKAKKGDGKDVHHKKPISKGGGNSSSNLRSTSRSANRSFKRTASGKMK